MSFPWAQQYQPVNPFMRWMDEKLPLPRLVYNAIGGGYPVPTVRASTKTFLAWLDLNL